jgi:hypothetical protein
MNKTKDLYGIPDPSFILPNLILGSKYDLLDHTIFEKFNIKSILCVAEECKHHQMKIPKELLLNKSLLKIFGILIHLKLQILKNVLNSFIKLFPNPCNSNRQK